MLKGIFLFLTLSFFSFYALTPFVSAAKKKTASKTSSKTTKSTKSTKNSGKKSTGNSTAGSGYSVKYAGYVNAYLRPDNAALVATFADLKKIKNVSYTLTYEANGQMEGVGGTVTSRQGNYVVRELFFGTCSSGVCRPHWGIQNMTFEAVITYKTGKTQTKKFTFTP